MRQKLILKVLLLFLVVLLCGASEKWEVFSIVNFNKRFVPIDKNLYADKYETTTKDYQLFLKEKREAGVDCSLLIYDSTVWRTPLAYNEPYVELYFWHPAFRDYPIVGVSHYAANEFCKWLTEKYEAMPKKKFKKVVFRLPTEAEFIKAARSIYDTTVYYPWGHNSLFDRKSGHVYCNYKRLRGENDSTYRLNDYEDYPMSVRSYKPNPYGIYNISGNVSEMIQEEGIAMGGDWQSTGDNVKITSKRKYENASVWLGFRVYMEIIAF